MKSRRQKGNQFQDWIQKYLESKGYIVHNQKSVSSLVKTSKGNIWVSKRNDLFRCFDILALHREEKILFIQATLHTSVSEKEKKIKEILNYIPISHCQIQLWQKIETGRIVISELVGDKFIRTSEIQRGKLLFYDKTEKNINKKIPK